MNYPIIIVVSILIIILIGYLIRRNLKDKKQYEQDIIESELPAEKDEKENI